MVCGIEEERFFALLPALRCYRFDKVDDFG